MNLLPYMVEDKYTYELREFGKLVKKYRLSKGLRQLDLEISTGIDRTDISKIENGMKNLEFYTMVRLSDALKLPLEEFFKYPAYKPK